MFFYAFKDRKVADSFLDSLKKVGLIAPGPEYIHVSKKDQLTGAELKAFYFPSKTTGYSVMDGSNLRWLVPNCFFPAMGTSRLRMFTVSP